MARILPVVMAVVLIGASLSADTKNGNANATSFARYSFTTPADGEFNATVVWTNSNVDIFWVLICADTVAATALGFQDRIAHIVVGLPGGLPCTLFLTTLTGATTFRLHAQHSADLSLKGGALRLTEGDESNRHEWLAGQQFQLLVGGTRR